MAGREGGDPSAQKGHRELPGEIPRKFSFKSRIPLTYSLSPMLSPAEVASEETAVPVGWEGPAVIPVIETIWTSVRPLREDPRAPLVPKVRWENEGPMGRRNPSA